MPELPLLKTGGSGVWGGRPLARTRVPRANAIDPQGFPSSLNPTF
jgi:hypothetical protein